MVVGIHAKPICCTHDGVLGVALVAADMNGIGSQMVGQGASLVYGYESG